MPKTNLSLSPVLTDSLTKTEEGGRRFGAFARPAVGWVSLSPASTLSKSSAVSAASVVAAADAEVVTAAATLVRWLSPPADSGLLAVLLLVFADESGPAVGKEEEEVAGTRDPPPPNLLDSLAVKEVVEVRWLLLEELSVEPWGWSREEELLLVGLESAGGGFGLGGGLVRKEDCLLPAAELDRLLEPEEVVDPLIRDLVPLSLLMLSRLLIRLGSLLDPDDPPRGTLTLPARPPKGVEMPNLSLLLDALFVSSLTREPLLLPDEANRSLELLTEAEPPLDALEDSFSAATAGLLGGLSGLLLLEEETLTEMSGQEG